MSPEEIRIVILVFLFCKIVHLGSHGYTNPWTNITKTMMVFTNAVNLGQLLHMTLLSTKRMNQIGQLVGPPGQPGVLWREEDRQESQFQVSGG